MSAVVLGSISSAVEGPVDEAVVVRLLSHVGLQAGPVHGKKGKSFLLERLASWNSAARLSHWLVLVDLDHDAPCATEAVERWLPNPSPGMRFRVAVREAEVWLMADREQISDFLGIPLSKVPVDPERLDDPKETLVNLARRSRRRDIREDMVPETGNGRVVGPAYGSRMMEYARSVWRPDEAAKVSDSLARCVNRLRELAATQND